MTREELATERNEVREILEGFSEELSQTNLDKLSRVFCLINGDEKRIAELTEQNTSLLTSVENLNKTVQELEKENAELKAEWQEQVQKATDEGYARTLQTIQLNKAKKILQKVVKDFHNMDCVSVHISKTIAEAEQFLKDLEK